MQITAAGDEQGDVLKSFANKTTGHKPVTLPLQVQCVHRCMSNELQPVPITLVVYI